MDRDLLTPPSKFRWPSPRTVARWLLVCGALYVVGWLIHAARSALLPFVIGGILAYLLLPPVNSLSRTLPRWAAILLVYAVGFGSIIGLFAYVVPLVAGQIGRFITAIPLWYATQEPWLLGQLDALIRQYQTFAPPGLQQTVNEGINNALATLRANAITYLTGIGNWLVNTVINVVNTLIFLLGFAIVPFWLFYVLYDQKLAVATLDAMIPRAIRTDVWNIWALIDRSLLGYIRGQLLLGLSVGTCAGIGLIALNMLGFKVDFILLLAITAGLTEFIPYIGPLLGAIPAVLVGLTDSPTTALAVAALYFVIQQLENQFLVPRIVGDSLNVHPAVLMITLIIGASLLGILGVILSAPLTAIARDVFLYLYNRLKDPSPQTLAASATVPVVPQVAATSPPPLAVPPNEPVVQPTPPVAPAPTTPERTLGQ